MNNIVFNKLIHIYVVQSFLSVFSLFNFIYIDTDWVNVNRGLFICDACCSIHRSLGRHVSQIKSLNADWCPVTFNVSTFLNLMIRIINI